MYSKGLLSVIVLINDWGKHNIFCADAKVGALITTSNITGVPVYVCVRARV